MGARTIYQNWMQGRATVRNRALRAARTMLATATAVEQGVTEAVSVACLYRIPAEVSWQRAAVVQWIRREAEFKVKRARQAHTEWLRWRRAHREELARAEAARRAFEEPEQARVRLARAQAGGDL